MATLIPVSATGHQAEPVVQTSLRLVTDNPSQEFDMVSPSLVDPYLQDWVYVDSDHLNSKEAAKSASTYQHALHTTFWNQAASREYSILTQALSAEAQIAYQSTSQLLNTCTLSGGLHNQEIIPGWKSLKARNIDVSSVSTTAIRDSVVPRSTTWPISSVTTSKNTSGGSIVRNSDVALDSRRNEHWQDTLLSNIEPSSNAFARLSRVSTHMLGLPDTSLWKSTSVASTGSESPLFKEDNRFQRLWDVYFPFEACLAAVSSENLGDEHSHFTISDDSERNGPGPLSEDCIMRGLRWSQSYFPPNWFDRWTEDEMENLERTITRRARVERAQYLAFFLDIQPNYVRFDGYDTDQFSFDVTETRHVLVGEVEIQNLHRSISVENIILSARRPMFIATSL